MSFLFLKNLLKEELYNSARRVARPKKLCEDIELAITGGPSVIWEFEWEKRVWNLDEINEVKAIKVRVLLHHLTWQCNDNLVYS